MATVAPGESLDQAMADFCQHIKDTVIPRNTGVAWDYLRVELWSDSGRIIAYPASSSSSERIEKAGCQVVFGDLLAEYEQLADSELDDNDFEAALFKVEQKWAGRFLEAARHVGLSDTSMRFFSGEQPL